MAVLNFAVPTSPYEGLVDSLTQGYATGREAKQNMLSFPEQMRQLQANTKLLETKAQFAEPLAQANLTQEQVKANYARPLADANLMQQQVLADYARPNAAADLKKQQLANILAGVTNKYADQNAQAGLLGSQLGNQEKKINLQTLAEKNAADIAEQKARSQYYQMGGGNRGGGVDQKNLSGFVNQLMIDNGWDYPTANRNASIYMSGSPNPVDQNGVALPPMSELAKQNLLNATSKNAPVAIKNQAANMDILVNDLDSYDIGTVKKFAGPLGVARLKTAQAMMAANPDDPNIDEDARKYLASVNESIINMDSMRKAFGTSVVPDYVYQTLGKLANPNSSIWQDPRQVEMGFNTVKNVMHKNRDALMEKVRHGVTAGPPKDNASSGKVTKTWKIVNGQLVQG